MPEKEVGSLLESISPGVAVLFNQLSAGLGLSGQESTHFTGHGALNARCLINPAL